MTEHKAKVFISHSSNDQYLADLLVKDLKKLGVQVWYDKFEILVGHDITDKVYQGLMAADYVAVILTESSVKSRWVQEELNYAKQRAITAGGKRVILPLLFKDCDIPAAITTLKYADFRESYSRGFEELAASLGIILLEARESPIGGQFWQKVFALFDNVKAGLKLSVKEAKAIAAEEISERVTLFYYTLRHDFQLSNREAASVENFSPRRYEYDDIDVLIYDHASLKVWRAFEDALSEFDDTGTSIEDKRQKAIARFRKTITSTVYSRIDGVKHETDILAKINSILTILASVADDLT
jgi:hypothetical protein